MVDVQLYCGDCLDVLPTIEANSIDAAICDLPFGTTSNAWDKPIDLASLWRQLLRVVKWHGAIILFATQPFTSELVMSNKGGYKHKWTWNKRQAGNFAVAKHMPLTVDEDILVFTGGGERANYYPIMRTGKARTKGGKSSEKNGRGFGGLANISYRSDQYFPTSILEFASVPRTKRQHASQKPTPLLRYLIETYSLPGQVIMDCTMGSGATGVACKETGRGFVGIELDAGYFEIARAQMPLLEMV